MNLVKWIRIARQLNLYYLNYENKRNLGNRFPLNSEYVTFPILPTYIYTDCLSTLCWIKQENIEFIQFDVKIWNILKVWRQHNSTRLFIKLWWIWKLSNSFCNIDSILCQAKCSMPCYSYLFLFYFLHIRQRVALERKTFFASVLSYRIFIY